jgi:dienelactone hydrolase
MGTGGVIQTKGDPTIPPVSGDCPDFKNSTIDFMGISGLQIVAGTKPAAPTAPMVLYWHGTVSNAGEFALMAAAVQQGVVAGGGILVSPNGTTGGDLLSGTSIFGAGDLKVMDQLVACAVKNNNIDPHKIYTMGCSAGGLMATATATERSSYIAAAAPNSGGWTVPVPFQDMHTPSLMTVHGAPGSDVVIVDFSSTSATADKAFKARGGFVIDCNTGGGHCGGAGLAGDSWKFFQAHPFGVDPEPWATMLPAGFSTQCTVQ